ncbi:hypothetical protein [Neobacillus sp. SuZ13]|nr:hypothetical protein [Neobacillus sp. SuZ13]WHY67080.1 hypothetical protein QNH17_29530 [Neobacillus sp. SuZ13]
MMEKEHSNEIKNDDGEKSTIYEEVKRKNIMDWGIIETAESVMPNKTRKS